MRDEESVDRVFTLLNVAFVVVLALLVWHWTGYELVPGVVTHTIGPCDLDWYRVRPTLVLACPGHDMIKVWPLPVETPWWEDVPQSMLAESAQISRALRL